MLSRQYDTMMQLVRYKNFFTKRQNSIMIKFLYTKIKQNLGRRRQYRKVENGSRRAKRCLKSQSEKLHAKLLHVKRKQMDMDSKQQDRPDHLAQTHNQTEKNNVVLNAYLVTMLYVLYVCLMIALALCSVFFSFCFCSCFPIISHISPVAVSPSRLAWHNGKKYSESLPSSVSF